MSKQSFAVWRSLMCFDRNIVAFPFFGMVFAFAGLLLGSERSLATAPLNDVRVVDVPVAVTTKGLEIRVPSGSESCVVEACLPGSARWYRWKTLLPAGRPLLSSFAVPKSLSGARWRATARVSATRAAAFAKAHKFPDAFYVGGGRFGRVPAAGYASGYAASVPVAALGGAEAPVARVATLLSSAVSATPPTATSVVMASDTTKSTSSNANASGTASQALEADIWKVSGERVYFFNQLRGLQVLDLTQPAAPSMLASLRLPAVGQDLYVLPGNPDVEGEALVVLLTGNYQAGAQRTEVVVVKVVGGAAQVVSKNSFDGWISDSRVVGRRLYLLQSSYDWSGSSGWGSSKTVLHEVNLSEDGSQQVSGEHTVSAEGGSAVICAGGDWLCVAFNAWSDWESGSKLYLYELGERGATRTNEVPLVCTGRVYDKFKVSFQGGVLTAVSQRLEKSGSEWWRMVPVALVENFSKEGAALSKPLELIRNEQLYATRFSGGKLYVVTAERTDPLWVVDLSDPSAPRVSGSVEVPGFSTYIEPVGEKGDLLFTIGMDGGKVAASLFDVSDVTQPTLKSRVFVTETAWNGYSEAVWDEKALKVLPEDGLVLVPFSGWGPRAADGASSSFVRLIDMDLANGGMLKVRGRLDHDFSPRRASLLGKTLISISQKELITADVSDRDKPSVMAEVGLAWPVNQVLSSGRYLLQVGDGSNQGWTGEAATLRVTSSDAPDAVLADLDLGEGTVHDVSLKAGRLYVLRKKWGSPDQPLPYEILGSVISARRSLPSKLLLDVYDASALPSVKLLGSASIEADSSTVNARIGSLVWVSDQILGVTTQAQVWSYGWEPPIVCRGPVMEAVVSTLSMPRVALASGVAAAEMDAPLLGMTLPPIKQPPISRLEPRQAALLRAFDVSNPETPVVLPALALSGSQATPLTVSAGGDGLFAFGYGEGPAVFRNVRWPEDREQLLTCTHKLGLADYSNPSKPFLRAPVVLPGRAFAVTDVSRSGMLVYSESVTTVSAEGAPVREVQVTAIDQSLASLVATRRVGTQAVLAAEGRALYVVDDMGAQRLSLDDSAQWVESPAVPLPFAPQEVAVSAQALVGVNYARLERVRWIGGGDPLVDQWDARIWVPAKRLVSGSDGVLYAPQGDYGVQFYQPALPTGAVSSAVFAK